MSDKDSYRQQLFEDKFEAFCQKWQKLLNLCNWCFHYEIVDIIDSDSTIEAQCNVNTQLGHEVTVVFAEKMAYRDALEREKLVIHELLHISLDEMGQFVYQHMDDVHQAYFTRLLEIANSDITKVLFDLAASIDEIIAV